MNPEAHISVRDSASTNDVDYILLSDDEESTERDIASARKVEVKLEHQNEGIPVNAYSSGRTFVGNLPAENVYQATINDASRMMGQKVKKWRFLCMAENNILSQIQKTQKYL